jgi:hypothetical protein
MSKEDEEILRAILEKGSDKAKKAAAEALAAQPSLPDEPVAVKQAKQKKKVKGLGKVIGKIGKSKFYQNKAGDVVDQDGQVLTGRLADILTKETETKKVAVQQAVAPTPTVSQDQKNAERQIGRELSNVVKATSNLARSHEKIITTMPTAFGEVEKVITNITEQHEKVVSNLIKQNDELREKIIEALTGVKTASKSGGAVKKKPSKGVGASRAAKGTEVKAAVSKKAAKEAKVKEEKEKVKERVTPVAAMKKAAKDIGFATLAGAAIGAAGYFAPKSEEAAPPPAGGGRGGAAPTGPVTKYEGLGSISAKYESGGKGVHTVSSGRGDPGGVSYGAHQLATNTGTMARYLASAEAKDYAGQFAGLQPGTEPFNQKYKQVAASDPQGFAASQKAFITRTHFDPVSKAAGDKGWATADPRIQEALYSMGVQHGGAKKIVEQAGSPQGKTVEEQVQMLYDARKKYVAGVSMPEATRQSLYNRYASEQRDVLAMSTPAGGPAGAPTQAAGSNFAVPGQGMGGATPNFGEPQKTGSNGNLDQAQLIAIGGGNHRLQPSAAAAYEAMVQAAKADGITWSITDSYRPYAAQVKVAQEKGLYSQGGLAARPGTSNHGWGTALDLGGGANSKGTKQNDWLVANAGRFGFSTIPREPWHWEYKGSGAAIASAGRPEAAPQREPGNALAVASQQNATDRALAENQARGGTVIMQTDRVVNNTRTVYQTASVSPRRMQQDFNPYNMFAATVTGRGLF